MTLLEKIPTVVTVAVLVGIFLALKRHSHSARLQLWMVAWFLIFTHFVAQLLEPAKGDVSPYLLAFDLGSLQAAAVAFLVSVSAVAEDKYKRTLTLLLTGIPSVAYGILSSFDVHARWPYVLCLAACFLSGILLLLWLRGFSFYAVSISILSSVAAVWAILAALHGSFDEGLTALLMVGYALPGIFLCRNYWRASPGILCTAGGFFCWGAVFPIGMLIDRFAPAANVPPELWNTPKMFVAFGMILAIVEDKSESIENMQRRQSAVNHQLERFSTITSQLLSGATVDLLCNEIASAITDVSNFRIAVIQLDSGGHGLRVAGASGLSATALAQLQTKARAWTTDDIRDFCSRGRQIGQNSYLLSEAEAAKYDPLKSSMRYDPNAYWNTGDELLIPLCSARGGYLGCIGLDDPRDVEAVTAAGTGAN